MKKRIKFVWALVFTLTLSACTMEKDNKTDEAKLTEKLKITNTLITGTPKLTLSSIPAITVTSTVTSTPIPTVTLEPDLVSTPTPTVINIPVSTFTPVPTVTLEPDLVSTPTLMVTLKPTLTSTPTPTVMLVPTEAEASEITNTPKPTEKTNEETEIFIGKETIYLGMSLDEIGKKFGNEAYTLDSEYSDCKWYVYNNDYLNLILLLVKDKRVVGVFADGIEFKYQEIGPNVDETYIREYGFKESYINFRYQKIKDNIRAEAYLDKLGNGIVKGIFVIYDDINSTYEVTGCEDIFSKLIFEITNSFRIKNGLEVLKWSDKAALSSKKHSQDMIDNNFFDHYNIEGESPFDRMEKEGIDYIAAAENIAAGYSNSIEAVYGWINSEGHRKNLLNDELTYLGVGVSFGGVYKLYYTQNFYKPR